MSKEEVFVVLFNLDYFIIFLVDIFNCIFTF